MWSEIPVPVLVIYGSLLLKNGSAGSSGLHQQCLEDRESRVAFHSLWGRRRVWESALGSAGNRPGTSHPAWSHLLNVWKHRIIEHGFHGLTKHQKMIKQIKQIKQLWVCTFQWFPVDLRTLFRLDFSPGTKLGLGRLGRGVIAAGQCQFILPSAGPWFWESKPGDKGVHRCKHVQTTLTKDRF